MTLLRSLLFLATGLFITGCSVFQKSTPPGNKGTVQVKSDSTKKEVSVVTSYEEFTRGIATTKRGLITVHYGNDRYYFEIPDTIMDKDILCVNRITKAAANIRPVHGSLGYSGDIIGENVIRFTKGPGKKLFIKRVSYLEVSKDSSENGLYRSVKNSNVQPIVGFFDIKAINNDSGTTIIDITDYVKNDNDIFFFNAESKKSFGLAAFQLDKSYVQNITSYPLNVEIQAVKTYMIAGEKYSTYELNSSLVLLPSNPMTARISDGRIGYFTQSFTDFDNPQGVQVKNIITRWRLEPKPEDVDRYLKGEQVEPQKPIVYYIDPLTPKKWIPYLIQGVNDWQKAFEKAGFKNAIYALEAPVNDSNWSLYDARHNAIIYKPSTLSNASGPHVHDPRSGEILETHINWYHNVIDLLYKWYFIQVSPNSSSARKAKVDDELMGQLIRFVCTHEVGHTLGLTHNFKASSTVPVDSLRSKSYVEKNGFCPSIMDYARFNYVAQPEDSISMAGLLPRIGIYDEWAIEWGYKWFPQTKSAEDQQDYLGKWASNRLDNDKRLLYATNLFGSTDPYNQAEDLGDNTVKSGYYGIKNLKRIMTNLLDWTKKPNSDYKNVEAMQKLVFNQYYNYLKLAATNIGGVIENNISTDQSGPVWEFRSKEVQRSAVDFFHKELFTTPEWFMNKDVFPYTGIGSPFDITDLQKTILFEIMSRTNFTYLTLFKRYYPDKSYSYTELLDDLEKGIWKEIKEGMSIDLSRRNLQKAYIERLMRLLETEPITPVTGYLEQPYLQTDLYSIVKGHIQRLSVEIKKAIPKYKDNMTRWHLLDINQRLSEALKQKYGSLVTNTEAGKANSSVLDRNAYGCFDFIQNDYNNWKAAGVSGLQDLQQKK